MGLPNIAPKASIADLSSTITSGEINVAHLEEVLQAPRSDAGVDERRDAVRQLPDGVAQQVEQRQRRERYRRPQLIALR